MYLIRSRSLWLTACITVFFALTGIAQKKTTKVTLFNGKDLSGWVVHGTEKWYVDRGELVCESGPDQQYGYLSTAEFYQDFDFSVQFKQETNGNSGVFFRSTFEGTKVSGWQVEVAGPNHDTGGIYESYGRGWMVQIPDEKEGYLKYGAWNTLRIRVVGGRVQTWLTHGAPPAVGHSPEPRCTRRAQQRPG